jgi:tetratricopeptide (TPR) repeat protein
MGAFLGGWLVMTGTGCGPSQVDLKQVMNAQVDYRNQRYRDADQKLSTFLRDYPDHPDSAEAYCLRSLCNVQLKNKARAEADAQSCVRLATNPDIRANAHATLASLLFESGRTDQAMGHYAKALKVLPDKPPADLVRYRYGICLQRAGRWDDARREFATVYQRHASSDLAPHAKRMYDWPIDGFSIQAGAFRENGSASELNQKLKRNGLPSRVDRVVRSNEFLYTVYVGKYAQYRDAANALPAVRRTVSDAFVMPN